MYSNAAMVDLLIGWILVMVSGFMWLSWRYFWQCRETKKGVAQVEHLSTIMQSDRQWLASNPIAREMCQRYMPLLGSGWGSVAVEPVDYLRERLAQKMVASKPPQP